MATARSSRAVRSEDLALYLVTDNTAALLGDRDLSEIVQAAVEGGVTIVQLRDKTSDTLTLISTAKKLHKICHQGGVPFVVNDRVDVALAAGADGVHIGQDDMPIADARKLLGEKAIIGLTVNSIDEAVKACKDGADYLGIGTVFATSTKDNTKSVIGIAGLQAILEEVHKIASDMPTVCIGGINSRNAQRVIYQSTAPESGKRVDGIAVVSAIIAAPDAQTTAADLVRLVKTPPAFASDISSHRPLTRQTITSAAPAIIKRMASTKPLCHNMTNLVVQNIAANVAICMSAISKFLSRNSWLTYNSGASPIMSNNPAEAADLASLGGSLVINMGTTTPEVRAAHLTAVSAYNAIGGPVLLDPVGAGATSARREGVRALLAGGYFDVIKGNEGEIRTVAGAGDVKQRGVDSGAATLDLHGRLELVRKVAKRERCVVLMTGEKDVLSDGERTVIVGNGHKLLGEITGSGCTLGTTIASVLAVEREDKLLGAVTAVLIFEIAAERAAVRPDVKGPGTFVPAFLDELYAIREESLRGDGAWAEAAKVEFI